MTDTLRIMDDWLKFIIKHKVELKPVLSRRRKIDFWHAGLRSVVSTGQNLVFNDDWVRGATPIEALEKLKQGIEDGRLPTHNG